MTRGVHTFAYNYRSAALIWAKIPSQLFSLLTFMLFTLCIIVCLGFRAWEPVSFLGSDDFVCVKESGHFLCVFIFFPSYRLFRFLVVGVCFVWLRSSLKPSAFKINRSPVSQYFAVASVIHSSCFMRGPPRQAIKQLHF